MGAQSARQWGCQAPLLLSKSSSHASPKVGILQSDDSSLEPAGCVMQLAEKGGHAGGVHRDQCQRCLLAQAPAELGARAAHLELGLQSTALGGVHRGWPGAGAVSQHPVSQTQASFWAWWKFLYAGEDTLPLPELPSLSNVRAIAPDRCWSLLLNQSDFVGCFVIFFNVAFFFIQP